jgi:hypothetical protein
LDYWIDDLAVNQQSIYPLIRQSIVSALPLFVTRVDANDPNDTASLDDFAVFAEPSD